MRLLLSLTVWLGTAVSAMAQPGPLVAELMKEPVSVWDLGLHRLQHRLDEMAATDEWIAGGRFLRVLARYGQETNRIDILARLYSFPGSMEQGRRKCEQLLNAVRTVLGVYPPFGQPAAPSSDLVEFFLREGQTAGVGIDMDRVGRALDKITRLSVEIFRLEDLRASIQCEGPLLGTQVRFDQ